MENTDTKNDAIEALKVGALMPKDIDDGLEMVREKLTPDFIEKMLGKVADKMKTQSKENKDFDFTFVMDMASDIAKEIQEEEKKSDSKIEEIEEAMNIPYLIKVDEPKDKPTYEVREC